jgi:hypothetical protein
VELWVDKALKLKNINGKNELRYIPFSEIKEYGEAEEECYVVFKNQTLRFPKNSFIEGSWEDMVKRICDVSQK